METNTPKTLLSDKVYNRLKLAAQILLPGLSALYFGLAEIWTLPYQAQISGTIAVVNVFVGVLITFAKALHEASGAQYDGLFSLEPDPEGEGSNLKLLSVSYDALETKDALTFKLKRTPPPVGVAE